MSHDMKRPLLMLIVSIFLLASWVSADRHSAIPSMYFATSFDFSQYPACRSSESRYCIQAVRFYDPDAHIQLAEVLVSPGASGAHSIGAAVRVRSTPHRVYAVAVYRDGTAIPKEGFPGKVSSFPVTAPEPRERASNLVREIENGHVSVHPGAGYQSAAEL